MDTDNSNGLTKQELTGFAKGGAKLTDDNLEKIFLLLDKDGSSTISYEEFEVLLMKKKKSKKLWPKLSHRVRSLGNQHQNLKNHLRTES